MTIGLVYIVLDRINFNTLYSRYVLLTDARVEQGDPQIDRLFFSGNILEYYIKLKVS